MLRAVAAEPGSTTTKLATALGMNRCTVRDNLRHCAYHGLIAADDRDAGSSWT